MKATPLKPILVIGGGLIGSAIAWRLAQRGANVTLADASPLGGEASVAGAGMLSPGAEAERASGGLAWGVESLRLYPGFIEELRSETGLEVEHRVTGCMMYGEEPGFERFLEPHRAAGLRVEQKGDGLFYPEDGLVVPPQLLAAIRAACRERGVAIEARRVAELACEDFSAVVVASGAWSGTLRLTFQSKPVELPATVPVKGHLLGFEFPPNFMGPFIRKGSIYVLQRAGGFVVVGSNEETVGFDASIQPSTCEDLHRRAAELLPALAGQEPVKRWIGFRPGLQAGEGPLMHRVAGTNVWLAYGHFRNGILLTPVTAQRVAREIHEA